MIHLNYLKWTFNKNNFYFLFYNLLAYRHTHMSKCGVFFFSNFPPQTNDLIRGGTTCCSIHKWYEPILWKYKSPCPSFWTSYHTLLQKKDRTKTRKKYISLLFRVFELKFIFLFYSYLSDSHLRLFLNPYVKL